MKCICGHDKGWHFIDVLGCKGKDACCWRDDKDELSCHCNKFSSFKMKSFPINHLIRTECGCEIGIKFYSKKEYDRMVGLGHKEILYTWIRDDKGDWIVEFDLIALCPTHIQNILKLSD